MTNSPEHDLQDAAVDLLHRHHYLVFHQRPSREADGGWRSAVEYDGKGFFDLVAIRPGCPALFIEVKADRGRVSADQRDWLEGGEQALGCRTILLHPGKWKAFQETVEADVKAAPVPTEWVATLERRKWRNEMNRGKKRIASEIRDGGTGLGMATMTTKLMWMHNQPFTIGSGSKIYLYRGHGSDESICGYGPVTWDGSRDRWAPGPQARFKVWPKGTAIKLKGVK